MQIIFHRFFLCLSFFFLLGNTATLVGQTLAGDHFLSSSSTLGNDNWFATDTLTKAQFGVTLLPEFMYQKPIGGKRGYGVELGFYYERRILERVLLTFDLNSRYTQFDESKSQAESRMLGDTAVALHLFNVERQVLKISTPISFRFYYSFAPKAYLLLSVGPEWNLSQKGISEYQETVYESEPYNLLGRGIESGVMLESYVPRRFNTKLEMGLGITFKTLSIEILSRHDALNRQAPSIGLRLRQQLGLIRSKKKR